MMTRSMGLLSLSLAALLGCSVKGGGDTDDTSSTGNFNSSTGGSDSSTGGGSDSSTGGGSDSSTGGGSDPSTGGGSDTTANPTSSTGGVTTGGDDGIPSCIDTPTVLAADEASPLGASANEVLADKLGERVTTLTFATEPTSLSEDVKGKQLPLTVNLRYEGGEVRWIDSEINPEWENEGTDGGFPVDCEDRLEIDVELDFVTEGGEFDEHPKATLKASSADSAGLMVSLIPPGLAGSLDLETLYKPDGMETVVRDVLISGTWVGTMAGGGVLHEILVGGEEDGFVGFGPLAYWGDSIEP